jgi:hypothetical protein
MKTMAAGKFKAQCLKVMDQVKSNSRACSDHRERPPRREARSLGPARRGFFGSLAGIIDIVGDNESPAEPPGG